MNQFRFLAFVFVLLSLVLGSNTHSSFAQYSEKYRPQYHFSPISGWMADPDGLVYYGGYYHIFWWGHAVSRDLVHWTELPWPMKGGDGSFAYYTGSAVVDKNNTAGFGPNSMVAVYSMHRGSDGKETVGLSSSQNYTDFNYYGGNPVINENSTDFRDPQVFWYAPTNKWIMVIALPGLHVLHFYSSSDLKTWQYLSDFGPMGAQGTLWETPDLFQLPVDGNTANKKWVLTVGVAPNRVQYFTGSFDGTRFTTDAQTQTFLNNGTGLDGTVYADFNGDTYSGWTTTGTAFGFGPDHWATPAHMGAGQVNSFGGGDSATGTLTSSTFTITKKAINFLIGGGNHPNQTCINLLVNNQVVRTCTGDGTLQQKWNGWDVSAYMGQSAQLQIVDSYTGSDLGYITLDHILFSDQLQNQGMEQALWADYGSDFYAARTWRDIDSVNPRTAWVGWLGNWEYAQSVPSSWGQGFQSVPREIGLTTYAEGVRLVQNPVPELQSLRGPETNFFNRQVPVGTTNVTEFVPTRNTYEIDAEFAVNTASTFGFNLLVGSGRKLMVGYNPRNSNLFVDRTNTSDWTGNASFARKMTAPVAAENGKIRFHIFVDQSSVEVFTNSGKIVLSALTYPGDTQTGIQLFSEDSASQLLSFRAWQLKSSWNQGAIKDNHVPGTLEAEDFNNGGEGGGYHDADAANQGGQYRTGEGVDIENCSAGGYNVAYINPGEWMAYNIKSDYTRTFQITARVAGTGGKFHLEMDGVDVTGAIAVPVTGSFQQWASVSRFINIPFGEHTLRFYVEEGGFNVDKFIVSSIVAGGIYKITARHSGKVMDSTSTTDGSGVQQWDSLGGQNQQWKVEMVEPGYYRITSVSSGKALDVNGSANGTPVQQWPSSGADKQKWAISNVDGDYFNIVGKASGKALEVTSSSLTNGSTVQQWDYLGGQSQQWKFDLLSAISPTLAVNDVTVQEGNSGTRNAVFTVSMSAPATQIVTCNYATSNSTANAGSDYTATSGTISISVGQTMGTIIVPITGDTLNESDETFALNLSAPSGATISDGQGIGTIVNDDPLPSLAVNDVTIPENAGNGIFTVSLSAPSGQTVTVAYSTLAGTATEGADYTRTTGTLTLAPGETAKSVAVPIFNDALDESDEAFSLKLSAPTNATLGDDTGVGTITDNDSPFVTSGGVYKLTARHSNKVMDSSGTASGAAIQQWDWLSGGNQQWKIEPLGANFYRITSLSSGNAIDVANTSNGTGALQHLWANTDNQKWLITDTGDGYFVLSGKASGKALEVTNSSLANGALVQQWDYLAGQNQQWKLDWVSALPPYTLSVNDVLLTEGNSGTKNAVFTVMLNSPCLQTVTVNYATTNGTATAGSDYTAKSGTLTFAAGQTSATVAVVIKGDTTNEANETFFLNLSGAVGATISRAQGTGTITNDDGAAGVSVRSTSLTEGNSGTKNLIFTVVLSARSGKEVKVNYATVNGTALAGSDYISKSGTLLFAPGELSETVAVPIIGDLISEPNETLSLKLTNAQNALVSPTQGIGTLVNDDGIPAISIGDASIREGDKGTAPLNFAIQLSRPSSSPVSVSWQTVVGTATAGADYLAVPPTTLTFKPGEVRKTVSVKVVGDALNEDSETLRAAFSKPTNATLSRSTATGTIADNDLIPSLKINDVQISEGNGGNKTALFTVSLSAPSGRIVMVNYMTANGTATAGSDYTSARGTLTFAPGQTSQSIAITLKSDTLLKPNESFKVELSNSQNATIIDNFGIGLVIDDDGKASAESNVLAPSASSS
ncbi:levanase [Abditibacteriota bacterium]|nr:levanase [Abditibacteriota bacterium]